MSLYVCIYTHSYIDTKSIKKEIMNKQIKTK